MSSRPIKHHALVLLDGDPLVDIDNARRIAAVVVNGRYLSKETLQKMLTGIEGNPSNK